MFAPIFWCKNFVVSALSVHFVAVDNNIDTVEAAVTGDTFVSFKDVMNDEYCRYVKVRTALNIKRKKRWLRGNINPDTALVVLC